MLGLERRDKDVTLEWGRSPLVPFISTLVLLVAATWVLEGAEALGDIFVPEGTTLVIDEDMEIDGDITVYGTLIIDGVDIKNYWTSSIYCRVFGTLKIINGANFHSFFHIVISENGSLEVIDSILYQTVDGTNACIDVINGRLVAINSTLESDNALLYASGSNVTLINTTITTERNYLNNSAVYLRQGTDIIMDGVSFTSDVRVLSGWMVGNVSILNSTFLVYDGTAINIWEAEDVYVRGTTIEGGTRSINVTGARSLLVEDCLLKRLDDNGCHISWTGNVTVDGLTIDKCQNVGVNITNCTNVRIRDLDVKGIGGDGIGVMSEYNHPFEATNVTVRYAQMGMYLIYTDAVTLEDINVEWCQRYGLQLSYCDGVDVSDLDASEAGIDGLYAGYTKGLVVEDSTLDGADECGAFLTHTPTSMTNVTARKCGQYGVRAALYSTFLIKCDLSFNGLDGLLSLDQGGVGLTDCIVEGNSGNGTRFVNADGPWVKGGRFAENGDAGLWVHYQTKDASVTDSDVEGNRIGVVLNGPTNISAGSTMTVRQTDIHNNTYAGAFNFLVDTSNLDARRCWWGNNTGPYNDTHNPTGTGDEVMGGMKFIPWLKRGNLVPYLKGPRDIVIAEEDTGVIAYSAYDWDNARNTLRFGLEGVPRNMTIDDDSGALRLMPDDPEVGDWVIFVTATDEEGGVGRYRVNLTVTPVNDPPVIVVPQDGIKLQDDDRFDLRLEAVDPDNGPDELTWKRVFAPYFIHLSPNGTVRGNTTWEDRGDHRMEVTVDDGHGGSDTAVIDVHVIPTYEPLSLVGIDEIRAYEDRQYIGMITVECDPAAVLGWEFITNVTWLVFNETVLGINGTPRQSDVGTVMVQLTVSDQLGNMDVYETGIVVHPVNDPPTWNGLPSLVKVNSTSWEMDLSLFASDPDDPVASLVYTYLETDPRLTVQGNLLVGTFVRGDPDLIVQIFVVDPHGSRGTSELTIQVVIPEEPGPDPTVADLFPWIIVVLVGAVGVGVYVSIRGRSTKD
jgi:polygalacturonase